MTHIDDAVPLDRDTNTQTTSPNWREKKFSGGSCPLKRQANLISDRKFIRSVWHVETERENGKKKTTKKGPEHVQNRKLAGIITRRISRVEWENKIKNAKGKRKKKSFVVAFERKLSFQRETVVCELHTVLLITYFT
jgi:hypothetical protein